MKKKLIYSLGIFFFFGSWLTIEGKIYVIHTAALIQPNYEIRKDEYITSLYRTEEYGYKPYVFEACHPQSPSFFEDYTNLVCYTRVNDYSLRNKGVNEAKSLVEGFKFFQFQDDDMIIKLTGRYWFYSPEFLQIVENHPEVDAFGRFTPEHDPARKHMITGCFAMRYKLFKEMLESIDYCQMEDEMIDFERLVGAYVLDLKEKNFPIMLVNTLSIISNIGSLYPPNYTSW